MIEPRDDFALVLSQTGCQNMYAIGGAKSIEMYDQNEKKWTIVQQMPTKL